MGCLMSSTPRMRFPTRKISRVAVGATTITYFMAFGWLSSSTPFCLAYCFVSGNPIARLVEDVGCGV